MAAVAVVALGCTSSADTSSGGDLGVPAGATATGPASGSVPGSVPGSASGPGRLDVYGDHRSAVYDDDAHWLCLPGRDDACAADLDATVVRADGTTSVEPGPVADLDAPIDCFYVYPTVSTDPTPNSDLVPDAAERLAAQYQVASLRGECRIFAPVYRQNTVASLAGKAGADPPIAERTRLAMADVVDAFKQFIAQRNEGRPFVLVGHSQGSGLLRALLDEEILGTPELRAKLVSAILPGLPGGLGTVAGVGRPAPLPPCTEPGQLGCAVAFSAFTVDDPPPGGGLFGPDLGGQAVCTNPAALGGGDAPLDARLPPSQFDGSVVVPGGPAVTTPLVIVPGLLRGRCVDGEGSRYLEVRVGAEPGDVRTGPTLATSRNGWGLHRIEVNLVLGDLVALVAAQSDAVAPG